MIDRRQAWLLGKSALLYGLTTLGIILVLGLAIGFQLGGTLKFGLIIAALVTAARVVIW